MQAQRFIQIGQTAARDPLTGEFMPAVPIYAEATAEIEQAEAATISQIGKIFAGKMKQYIDGGGVIEKRETKGAIQQ